jgi:hypothetical protein
MLDNKPTEKEICGINVRVGTIGSLSGGIRILYHFKKGSFLNQTTFEMPEDDVFETKEELVKKL